jgi:hypothetical protein
MEWANQRFNAVHWIQEEHPSQQLWQGEGAAELAKYSAQMAAAIVMGMKWASEAEREKKDTFVYPGRLMWPTPG